MKRHLATLTLSSFAILSAPALADENLYTLSLEELLNTKVDVVSSFMEKPTEAAASIFHIKAKQWQQVSAFYNSDVFAMSPSLMILPSTGDSIAIRGYANTLSRRGIATLIDGISVNEIAFGSSQQSHEHISLGVADSIDIIRGPASVQYGTDAFHGVLSFKTYYREQADNQIRVTLGTEGEARSNWHYSQPYGNSHYFNLAIDRLEHNNDKRKHWVYGDNGVYENATISQPKRLDREENHDIRSALFKWHNGSDEALQYEFSVLHNKSNNTGLPGGGQITGYTYADEVGNISENNLVKLKLAKLINDRYEYGFIANYQNLNRNIPFQFNLPPTPPDTETPYIGSTHTSAIKESAQLYSKYHSSDNTLRISSNLEYTQSTIDEAHSQFSLVIGDLITEYPSNPSTYDGYKRSITSAVLQGRKTFTNWDLDLEFGGRIDWYSDLGRQATPRLALIKDLPKDQVVKLIYGESFRAPTTAEQKGSTSVKGNSGINPETLTSIELSYSRQFEYTFIQATLYDNQWEDGITVIDIADPDFSRGYVNIANNSGYGAELSLLHEKGPWQLNTDLSYIRSKDELNNIDYSAFPKFIWNTRINYAPNQEQSFFISQRILHDMTVGHNTFPNEDLPTYVRFDIGYEHHFSPQLSANIVIKNLSDKELRLPNVDNGPVGTAEDRRTLFMSASYAFK